MAEAEEVHRVHRPRPTAEPQSLGRHGLPLLRRTAEAVHQHQGRAGLAPATAEEAHGVAAPVRVAGLPRRVLVVAVALVAHPCEDAVPIPPHGLRHLPPREGFLGKGARGGDGGAHELVGEPPGVEEQPWRQHAALQPGREHPREHLALECVGHAGALQALERKLVLGGAREGHGLVKELTGEARVALRHVLLQQPHARRLAAQRVHGRHASGNLHLPQPGGRGRVGPIGQRELRAHLGEGHGLAAVGLLEGIEARGATRRGVGLLGPRHEVRD
mmetsp:Transcript_12275/g.41542  ORF Transcript_12275/g.41542 Transcript_12275/m.41542 type:complete len:274 (-) Transcript_12275:290-1111(-)